MTQAMTPAMMVVRVSRYLPRDLAGKVSPAFIAQCCQTAWDNGWRDPEWLANHALTGTEMPNVTNAAAMFSQRLREASDLPCPEQETPTPPREINRAPGWSPPATAEQRAHWAQVARDGLAAAKRGDVEGPWIGDAEVDPWEVGA